MKPSSRRKAIAITAGLALVAGSGPAYGLVDDTRSMNAIITSLVPGEDNVIPNNVDLYLGTHYSVRKKDDGKLLYSWGQAVKKPTDIRFVAQLDLPPEWYAPELAGTKGLKVTKAELRVKHSITNNPNDQIRPEDWENEGAIGLQPEYTKENAGTTTEKWLSTRDCYEGDGDFIPLGTVLRDRSKEIPGALSSDLLGGYSNAWYTTVDRDPFGWAYKVGVTEETVAFPTPPITAPGPLVSGPRWRLLNTKFGQNIPHTDMPKPLAEDPNNPACIPPPYEKTEIKYEAGDLRVDAAGNDVPTTINLLDWKKDLASARWLKSDGTVDAQSPLAYTSGWTSTWAWPLDEATIPGQVITDDDAGRCLSEVDGSCVTSNGTKLTDKFDVSFFVKGDLKPVRMYWAELYVEYVDATGNTITHKPAKWNFTTDDIIADKAGTTDAMSPHTVIKDGDEMEPMTGDTMVGKIESGKDSGTQTAILDPIDSEFTYDIKDFVGATARPVDGVAEEGWAANYPPAPAPVEALLLADTETLLMSSVNLVGTWGAGLGGATVKTSAEQFTAMEHVLSCYQTVPYDFWKSEDDYDAVPREPSVPAAWAELEGVCAATRLPNPFLPEAFLPPAAGPLPVLGTVNPNDGVLMPTAMVRGNTYAIPVAVNGIGTLTASFDWNDDGDFLDANEALAPIANAQGMWQVQVTIPADAALGVISTKFVVVTDPGGAVGEVETYDTTILATATTPAPATTTTPAPATTTTPAPATTTTPAPAAPGTVVPTAVITVKAVSKNTKLFVDVDPNKGKGYWNIRVYRKVVKGDKVSWKKVGKTLRTKTTKETRTINLGKGTYQVKVMDKYGMKGAVSQQVKLVR